MSGPRYPKAEWYNKTEPRRLSVRPRDTGGDPMFPKPTIHERFWAKVSFTETCWLWVGAKNPKGYPQCWNGQRVTPAHRFAYEFCVGPIPEGLEIDHLCRVRNCVNPDHLEPVTHRENTLRGFSPMANNARRTHCPKGHLYDAHNILLYRGSRYCRACKGMAEALVR